MVPASSRIPVIYYLPKIHKDPVHPPGRPIISGIDSISSRAGKYIDGFLQPLVRALPAFIRDSKHVINIMNNIPHEEGLWLVTADVTSLYTIIPHDWGISSVKYFLERDSALLEIQQRFIMDLLQFATTHNFFWFGGKYFLQKRGVAMGAKFAPSLANLFMGKWEEDVVYADRRPELVLWARYIDDVLLLWRGSRESLVDFMDCLNTNNRGIEFKYEADQEKINFLDLEIRVEDGQFVTSTYFKSSDRNSFIPRDSCHHKAWLDSVPKSQYLRLRRNCSKMEDFDEQAKMLTARFLNKGYQETDLFKQTREAKIIDRNVLLQNKCVSSEENNQYISPFITSYSNQHYLIKKLVKKHWHLIKEDAILGPALPEQPRVVFRGVPSLRDSLAPGVVDPPLNKPMFFQNIIGYHKCQKCAVCKINAIKERKTLNFISNSTSQVFNIKSFITCSMTHVVYLLICPCGLQYVGRTVRKFQVRVNEHIGNIRRGFREHSVSRHYREVHARDPSGTSFIAIDTLKPHWRGGSKRIAISKLEMSWIYRMKCLKPQGLNVDIEVNAFLDNS